jgi:hypothetical protein
MNEKNEAKVATDAFKSFAEQFGPDDAYTRIIIEVLLEELMNYSNKDIVQHSSLKDLENGSKIE